MKTIEYQTMNKPSWGDGAWQNEPDKKQWLDPATGFPCLIVRNNAGALCGYVGVASNHPLFETNYAEANEELDVHGGLTFSDFCMTYDPTYPVITPEILESEGICHVIEDGENDKVWWFGFDCAHYGDKMPCPQGEVPLLERAVMQSANFLDMMMKLSSAHKEIYSGEYRDINYVTAQVESLAQQLKTLADK